MKKKAANDKKKFKIFPNSFAQIKIDTIFAIAILKKHIEIKTKQPVR